MTRKIGMGFNTTQTEINSRESSTWDKNQG
jgi:hypothetical protein